jgi:predicted YcjX-like family ATPase
MVHRAQAQCAKWLHQLRRARQSLPNSPPVDRAEREFHDAVMLYWEQIKRFAHRENIEREWHETAHESIPTDEGTLASVRELRLATVADQVERVNPETMGTRIETVTEAWTMTPPQALAVYDQLDECSNKLGFDAEPVNIRKRFGYLEVEDEEEVETTEFGPKPVETPA